ncbi:nitric oxide reductase transcriptional regulator NorR [Cupriavidus agavae]|uniref:Anaerobic nitric oxide reductase transcription regulator n=1 Tax=Cupriavidus agavae TaxID=1001822 RepID=A0A4Q7RG98_9BURK|nr:nitric oxide reductase transcriptional regulator NorR [Cupriavidus agavae]RZT32326.1 anaerobic nitric oxide reductase transcription regulator [Cupriavidus agavae]
MIGELLLADLCADLPPAVRMQRMVVSLRAQFRCGAVALLQHEEDHLRPVAVDGLVRDALGRRFAAGLHPRLAAIVARRGVTCFHHDSTLPDPYDGLIDERVGEPLPVHDCMGVSLHVEGKPWGVLTLDALEVGTFTEAAQAALQRLTPVIEAALRITRLEAEIRALRQSRADAPAGEVVRDDGEIIGQSEAIAHLLHELRVVADSELPVLLLGETGVGKELFAHRLHRQSRRRNRPLIHVNCAALPESLAESELFGHVRGAFSGATGERPGRFEAADGGTLFLDEVGELPLSIQAKLLRTLQNGEIQRLGSDRPRRVDVRVIAATNRHLREHVRAGSFRADLYHRLSVYPVPIPPLRERDNDVLLLAGHFLELNRARLGLRSLRLSAAAQVALRRYPWPGNVRELEHVISRAALKLVSRGASRNEIATLDADLFADLFADGLGAPVPGEAPAPQPLPGAADMLAATLREAVDACQRACIERALAAHGGNWAGAARQLGVDASNLHKLARRLGFRREDAGRSQRPARRAA